MYIKKIISTYESVNVILFPSDFFSLRNNLAKIEAGIVASKQRNKAEPRLNQVPF